MADIARQLIGLNTFKIYGTVTRKELEKVLKLKLIYHKCHVLQMKVLDLEQRDTGSNPPSAMNAHLMTLGQLQFLGLLYLRRLYEGEMKEDY